jgi:hypothetical protein
VPSSSRSRDPVEEAAGRLYGLPLEDFVRERDTTARELRKAKDRDAAAAVAKLPKPSQSAWVANTLAREQRKLVKALLKAGDKLRAAQEGAVAGKGGGSLREATAVEREAVDALVEAAKELKPAGRKPTAQTLERLRTTLHAAATDDDVRAALDAGRLLEDVTGGGAWGLMEGWDPPAVTPRRAKSSPRGSDSGEPSPGGSDSAREAAEAAAAAERGRRQQLEAELREARAERRSRERELDRAEKTAARASKRLEAALAAAEDAREQAEEAKSDLDTARTAAEEARDHAARLEEQLD